MRLQSKTLIWPQPDVGVIPYDLSVYLHPSGLELVRSRCTERKSDIYEEGQKCYSLDNGRTWSDWEPNVMSRRLPEGILRTMEGSPMHDRYTGRSVQTVLEGLFPHEKADDCLAGLSTFYNKYRVYEMNSRKPVHEDWLMQKGYSREHPLEKVWIGKNAMDAMGPFFTSHGGILMPIPITVLGPDGKIANPGGGFTWHEIQFLVGRWRDQGQIEWNAGACIQMNPERSTRGAIEPTLAEFPDGRILMVFRGSNDANPAIPGYKWFCVSHDDGLSWTDPRPWHYSDGTPFFSPSSSPQLTRHSNGKVYWNGHLTPENPDGNAPRYPLVIGEVDPQSLMLIRESVFTIDTRQPHEPETISMHRLELHEDRQTGEFVAYMTRCNVDAAGTYTGDSWEYRIAFD